MERTQVINAMGQLKLYGMRTAYDEIIATALKRQHEPQQIIGDLLNAEISEKQARSIKYQLTIAKLPLAKEIEEFDFEATEINETLIRDLATGDFLDHQRNLVLIGGTGTGKTHLAVAIARACIRDGRRGRFFNVVDLVNKLDAEARAERQGRTAELISRLDFLILDELGYLPFAQTGGHRWRAALPSHQQALRAHLVIVTTNLAFGEWPDHWRSIGIRRCKDDHGPYWIGSPIIARSSKPATRVGASKTAPEIAISAKPGARRLLRSARPAAPFRKRGGQFCTPIRGHDCMPIDSTCTSLP